MEFFGKLSSSKSCPGQVKVVASPDTSQSGNSNQTIIPRHFSVSSDYWNYYSSCLRSIKVHTHKLFVIWIQMELWTNPGTLKNLISVLEIVQGSYYTFIGMDKNANVDQQWTKDQIFKLYNIYFFINICKSIWHSTNWMSLKTIYFYYFPKLKTKHSWSWMFLSSFFLSQKQTMICLVISWVSLKWFYFTLFCN